MLRFATRLSFSFANAQHIIVNYKDLLSGKNIKPVI